MPNRFITLCGRQGEGESSDTFGDEKTCETCLRINAIALLKSKAQS